MTVSAEQYLLDGEAQLDGWPAECFDGDLGVFTRLRLPELDAEQADSDDLYGGLEVVALEQARREHRRERLLSFEIAARTMELMRQARSATAAHRRAA